MKPSELNADTTLLSLYDYEYGFIPNLIELSIKNTKTWYEFIYFQSNIDWILNTVLVNEKYECDFDVTELSAEVFTDKNYAVIVYTFPHPSKMPLAKYGAIVLNKLGIKYFTLEKSMEDKWVLGGMSGKEHINYGFVEDCHSTEQFFKLLKSRGFVKQSFLRRIFNGIFTTLSR